MEDFSAKLQMEESKLSSAKTDFEKPHEETTLGKLDSVSIIVFSFSCVHTVRLKIWRKKIMAK